MFQFLFQVHIHIYYGKYLYYLCKFQFHFRPLFYVNKCIHINISRMEPGNDRERDLLNQAIHPKYVCKFQRNRTQQYDRRDQYHAVTHNPRLGRKLPMVVKLPMISPFFEQVSHLPYANQRRGIFNGLFIVPESANVHFQLPPVKIGNYNPLDDFFQSPCFKLIDTAFNLIYNKLTLLPAVQFNHEHCKIDHSKNQHLIDYSKCYNPLHNPFIKKYTIT